MASPSAVRRSQTAGDGIRGPRGAADASVSGRKSAVDPRDETIQRQRELIRELRATFTGTMENLREDFSAYISETNQIQDEMLARIVELKAEIRRLKANPPRPADVPVRSSLYQRGAKVPRKLAAEAVRRSQARFGGKVENEKDGA